MHPEAAKIEARPASVFPGLNQATAIRGAIIAAFAVLLLLACARNVNWDEFFFLSQVHEYQQGRLDRPLQTFHVHFFGWLAVLPGNEMTQIAVARLMMTGMLAITAVSIWRIARAFADKAGAGSFAAGIAVLAYLTSGYVLPHGASFRTDPIAAALLMAALAIVLTGRLTLFQIAPAALFTAIALLVTIKSVLYFPVLLGALIWRARDTGALLRMSGALVLACVIAAVLYVLHASGLDTAPGRDAASTSHNALRTTFLDAGLAPRWRETVLWALLSVGPLVLAVVGILRAPDPRMLITLVLFTLPLFLSILFYRNAFAYFFPFIVPPLMVAVAVGVVRLGPTARISTFVFLMLISAAWQSVMAFSEGARLQHETLAEVHRLFPEPVPYIDQNAMVSSFPRDVFFMSTWGTARYRAAGKPVMAELIAQTEPPLLLATRQNLLRVMTDPEAGRDPNLLLQEDIQTLRDTYVHYSGAIWLAGKDVVMTGELLSVALPFSGNYRVESEQAVMIDGVEVTGGQIIHVTDPLSVTGPEGTVMRFIWDTGVAPAEGELSSDEHYAGFWLLSF